MDLASLSNWIGILGLSLNAFGASLLAIPLFKSKRTIGILVMTGARIAGGPDEQARKEFEKDRRLGRWGLGILAAGFILQLAERFI